MGEKQKKKKKKKGETLFLLGGGKAEREKRIDAGSFRRKRVI